MFSNRIANSARFLQMPAETQNLYFHLVLRADDDGVVESYPIMKLLGVGEDSFKVLLAKKYIRQLNEDQVIVIIDWLEHNVIRADRKVDSIYKHLLPQEVKTIEAKPRSDVEDNSKRTGSGQSTDAISKVKLSKDKLIQDPAQSAGVLVGEIIKLFEEIDPKNKTYYKNTNQRNACEFLLKEYGLEEVKKRISFLPRSNKLPYFPTINTPIQLRDKWVQLQDAVSRKRGEIKSKVQEII